jgi:hypothetical protein
MPTETLETKITSASHDKKCEDVRDTNSKVLSAVAVSQHRNKIELLGMCFAFFLFIIRKREERTPFVAAGLHCRSVVRE